MKIAYASAAALILGFAALTPTSKQSPINPHPEIHAPAKNQQKIQAAILLDVSGSMSGLIEQAKAQLWNMVSVMGRAKCENGIPKIEIALYEYGRPANDEKTGYIKQISPFTSDLDKLSQELFKLTIDGGDEYCGQVIHTSLEELNWDAASTNYKVIFIAGNEDFLQGKVHYSLSCETAKKKGVIVNTIYCGPKEQGIREHWNLGGECGRGSFTNIDHNAKTEDVPTPFDSILTVLNNRLNGTYIYYGAEGASNYSRQSAMDKSNAKLGRKVAAERAAVKANAQVYLNTSWDLVDAVKEGGQIPSGLDSKTLPDSLRNLSQKDLKKVIDSKSAERGVIQKEMAEVVEKRNGFLAAERARAATNNTATLETQVEKAIREQVKRYNMIIE